MTILTVLAPVLVLVIGGLLLRRNGFPGDGFWEPAEKLTYFLLFPALIVATLSGVSLRDLPWLPMAAALATSQMLVAAAVALAMLVLKVATHERGGLMQGAIRMNTYVGIAISQGLFAEQGVAHAAVAIAIIVPLVNVISVSTLACCSSNDRNTLVGVAAKVLANPLIVACLIGIGLNVASIKLPAIAEDPLRLLGRGALPLGLLVVGASISVDRLRRCGGWELSVTAVKLAALPAIGFGLLTLLDVGSVPGAVSLLFLALPTAPSAYLLTKQMGGDAPQMATLITIQTLVSAVTLPFWLSVAN